MLKIIFINQIKIINPIKKLMYNNWINLTRKVEKGHYILVSKTVFKSKIIILKKLTTKLLKLTLLKWKRIRYPKLDCFAPPNIFGPKHNFDNHMDHFCNFVYEKIKLLRQ